MESLTFSYATPNDTKKIFSLFYTAFNSKFRAMLPKSPEKGFILYYNYFYQGLQKKKNKIIILTNEMDQILGFLFLEGLGVRFFSRNPSLRAVGQTISALGFKKFLRLFVGMLLIEGYPPSTDYLYINTLIINKSFQGKGLGKKFIRLAEKIAEKRNFKGLCLYVDIDNEQALKFYDKLGFQEDSGFGGNFVKNIIGVKY